MSLPKTLEEVIVLSHAQTRTLFECAAGAGVHVSAQLVTGAVRAIVEAAGIKVDHDGQTLIYPSTTGTNTPRYQVPEQRNVRFRGRRK